MQKPCSHDGRPAHWTVAMALLAVVSGRSAIAYTPKDPQVLAAAGRAIKFLESPAARDAHSAKLGAKALVGMAILKHAAALSDLDAAESPSGGGNDAPRDDGKKHPKVVEAADAIQKYLKSTGLDAGKVYCDIYSTGLSAIFLIELDSDLYAPEIQCLMDSLKVRQKPHGGWGYPERLTGDTSMTQYGVLSSWEAIHAGFRVEIETIDKVAAWLLKTQDPSGAFGYQGRVSDTFQPIQQSDTRLSMVAAGLGSVYICADLLGLTDPPAPSQDGRPSALQEVKLKKPANDPQKRKTQLNRAWFKTVEDRGNLYMQAKYRIDPSRYIHYYLYALERYRSFRELAETGKINLTGQGPKWYNDGVKHLLETQAAGGSWKSDCEATCDTAFGVLFLLRSTGGRIKKIRSFGDGLMVGGRGLPKDSDDARVQRGGSVAARPMLGPAEELLAALGQGDHSEYDAAIALLARKPAEHDAALLGEQEKKLRELASDRSPEARMVAVRTLGRSRNFDNVPTLIYALSDPDPMVVREARDGLRRISRKPAGFGLPDRPTELELREKTAAWKAWYLAIRPDAEFEN